MLRRKLTVAIATMGLVLIVFGVAEIPAASADTCVITVTLLGGVKESFTVPAGTPVSSLPVTGPVVSSTQSCSSSGTTSSSTSASSSPSNSSSSSSSSTTTSSPNTSSTSSTTSHSQRPPKSSGPGGVQKPSTHQHSGGGKSSTPSNPKAKGKSKAKSAPKPNKPAALRGKGGAPTAANPTFSFALPGPAPLGVPNFFIDSFRIPPFLLPIYQAAGIEYDVPWQVLAAINEIETDYGRNLSVSSAGAVGWMQFMPSTWKTWGVDANGDGVADPYNPVDAIFSAGRYLHAAGASQNIGQAIYAYNHATWYVQSVLLRAKLIGGMPSQLISALTGLVQGHFPVAAASKYADDSVEQLATRRVHGGNAAIAIGSDPSSKATAIYAKQGAPVIAVNDGRIVKIGTNKQWGHFVQLQDQTGNTYTYAQLGSVAKQYAVPKPVKLTRQQLDAQLSTPALAAPKTAATAGQQPTAPTVMPQKARSETHKVVQLPQTTSSASQSTPPASVSIVKERLFADPHRPASYAAGGRLQVQTSTQQEISSFNNYFSDVLHLAKNQYTLAPLRAGAIVMAGTILARLGGPTASQASHMQFMIQPAGKNAPMIDAKPILDGWKLLEATAVYRASGIDPFFGPHARNPTIGQILLMSKEQLQNRILQDPHVSIYACGRRDIQTGVIDRRILAAIEFLSASGLDPKISGLKCGSNLQGTDAAGVSGSSADISKINGIPILGHQGPGSVTDMTIRRLLTLQGAMSPDQIISTMSYKGQDNTLALPDHQDRIQVAYTPLYGANKKLSAEFRTILQPGQWAQLINRISMIPEPVVPITPSQYAIRTSAH